MSSALLVAWSYGLGDQYGADIAGVLLGTIAVTASLVIVALLIAIGSTLWHRAFGFLVAPPLGFLHGSVWSAVVARSLRPILADFTVPLAPVWIAGSICGLLGAAFVQNVVPAKLITGKLSLVSISTLLVAFFGPGLMLASCMMALLLDDGDVFDRIPSPNHRVTALLIADDCGATCSCEIRIDLNTEQRYVREVYRSDACEVWATWQSDTQLYIRDSDGNQTEIDTRTFGLTP
jgi:hypothetical protein